MPDPVTSFTGMYVESNDSVIVTWSDMDNVRTDDRTLAYFLSYNISVGDGIVLLSDNATVTPDDVTTTMFSYTISEGDFIQSGVMVNVIIRVCDMLGSSSPIEVTVNVTGGTYIRSYIITSHGPLLAPTPEI